MMLLCKSCEIRVTVHRQLRTKYLKTVMKIVHFNNDEHLYNPLPPGTMLYQKIPHAIDDIVAEPQHCVRGEGEKNVNQRHGINEKGAICRFVLTFCPRL